VKILVFGGSFDPPHRGHAALLRAGARRLRPDLILVVPAWRNPQKGRRPEDSADRAAMARLGLVEELPAGPRRRARVDLTELRGAKPVYTAATLRRLARAHRGAELHFLTGWDAAVSLPSWGGAKALPKLARWWTARRPGEGGKLPRFVRVLPDRMPDVSSSEVRARLTLGEDAPELLTPAVRAHIARRRLYGLDRLEKLAEMLAPARFEHSRCVARLAGALARRWGLDEGKALLAGLLHDCGRSVPVPRMGAYARRRRLKMPALAETARHNPVALHAHISEDLCRRTFGVDDAEVLSAVRKHTLADAEMSPLDRALYVADCCSEDRTYPEAAGLRRLAFDDLDEAARACMANKIRWCVEDGAWLNPLTLTAWNSLIA
jgi:nicotinate-nucleotide adenylyltransferase